MNYNEIVLYIYNLNVKGIFIWEENNNIKLFIPKNIEKHEFDTNFIKTNKEKFIHVLKENNLNTKEIKILKTSFKNTELSFSQERLLYIDRLDEENNHYNLPILFKFPENINLNSLLKALNLILKKHEILRTIIKKENGNYYQIVEECIKECDVFFHKKYETKSSFEYELYNDFNYKYNLLNEIPIKFFIYSIENDLFCEKYLLIQIHHIAFDGWSSGILISEIDYYYSYFESRKSQELNNILEDTIQYKDFAIWQKHFLQNTVYSAQLKYWKNKLENFETLNLPVDINRKSNKSYGFDIPFELDYESSLKLINLAKSMNVSLFSLLLGGFYILLMNYCNQDDIIIGVPLANRNHKNIKSTIGLFVNTLPIRIKIDPNSKIIDFLKLVGEEVVNTQINQDIPFEKIVEELKVERNLFKNPIFQVMFTMGDFEEKISNLLLPYNEKYNYYTPATFDLTLAMEVNNSKIKGALNYSVNLFEIENVNGIVNSYIEILKSILLLNESKQQCYIKDINLINSDQYNKFILNNNYNYNSLNNYKSIIDIFYEQVKLNPNGIAIIYNDISISYEKLNFITNQIALYLKEKYLLTSESLISLCFDRNEYIIIGILSILKSGAAYVPIDPNFPDDRIKYIISDSNSLLVISNEKYQNKLRGLFGEKYNDFILPIDSIKFLEEVDSMPRDDIEVKRNLNSLAYVIYTSGTTGKPKGVLIEQLGVVNLIRELSKNYEMSNDTDSETMVLLANFVFDASIEQIFLAILNGFRLLIVPNNLWLDKKEFLNYLNHNNATHIDGTPSLLSQYDFNSLKSLKRLVFGGEKLNSEIFEKIKSNCNFKIINTYGPTEATVTAILNTDQENPVYIGKPIKNVTSYVVNYNLKPVPIGAIGELCIGGIALARGYLKNIELTDSKFILNPFQSECEKIININSKIYKTGDLVRWRLDGNLEYIGRSDCQIKIRGYRVEISEIENTILSYENISQCVVVLKSMISGNINTSEVNYLIAYYMSDKKICEISLLSYLEKYLPTYMIPSQFIHLNELPLTVNGKIDIKALKYQPIIENKNNIPPRNILEDKVSQIWSDILSIPKDQISIFDSFYKIGGNSILSIMLIDKINEIFDINLKVSEIILNNTIENIASIIYFRDNSLNLISNINFSISNKNMFMIHPGDGGCEIYFSLAHALRDNFKCYGVESYNLYNENKILCISELSEFYLKNIDKIMGINKSDEYHLFGWCFGGLIALQIAKILENRGVEKINLYLLDSFFIDKDLKLNISDIKPDNETLINHFKLLYQGLPIDNYLNKLVSNYEYDAQVLKNYHEFKLKKSKLVLFKSMIKGGNLDELEEILFNKEYNNIDKLFENKKNIYLVKMHNSNHDNILKDEELIVSQIIKGKGNFCEFSN
ncbi:non-ribosomal peptide synthetase [Silvanigrella aquatica]|uniref:Carrier domain-containing protein n=1 Tax=Silvanigrella aquatica TaxID=1915309 RepID=A0A1L4CXS8_9BACT|nr:non-ribosomal peptide synthetase [Silvanigrella aquatica]APJ02763.1 hypothetical protein AXG55_02015 [Silvanigrella aquatica]